MSESPELTKHLKSSQKLKDNGLTINVTKCELERTEIDFLGYHITKDGYVRKLKSIKTYLKLETIMELLPF